MRPGECLQNLADLAELAKLNMYLVDRVLSLPPQQNCCAIPRLNMYMHDTWHVLFLGMGLACLLNTKI